MRWHWHHNLVQIGRKNPIREASATNIVVTTRKYCVLAQKKEGDNNNRIHHKYQNNSYTVDEAESCYRRLNTNFENPQIAYKGKSNAELLRALFVFRLCSINYIVQHNQAILKLLHRSLGSFLFQKIMKLSFFGHFCAGENLNEVNWTIRRLSAVGVKPIIDYSVESDITQEEAEAKAMEGITEEKVPQVVMVATSTANEAVNEAVKVAQKRYAVHREFADRRMDVYSARTYFYEGEKQCDKNAEIICNSIDITSETATTLGTGFTAVKLTSLGRPQLLLKLSKTIVQTQLFFKALTGSTWENLVRSRISEESFKHKLEELGGNVDTKVLREWFKSVDFDNDGFVDFFDWVRLLEHPEAVDLSAYFRVPNIETGKLEPLIKKQSDEEKQNSTNMIARLVHVADYAGSKNIRLMIDAEQSYFQPAISRLTLALMRKYNKEGGMILNTYQAYRTDCLSHILIDLHIARREDFFFGCKLVRGAYMDQERKRAAAIGYEDPINKDYNATTEMYHSCLNQILNEWRERGNRVAVMVASHNADSIKYAVERMKEYGIPPSARIVCFGQLYGMCDQVSFSLADAGYSVYKYLPYGEVEKVLSYLSRRALENGAMLDKIGKERHLLWTEMKRRLRNGQFIYKIPITPRAVTTSP